MFPLAQSHILDRTGLVLVDGMIDCRRASVEVSVVSLLALHTNEHLAFSVPKQAVHSTLIPQISLYGSDIAIRLGFQAFDVGRRPVVMSQDRGALGFTDRSDRTLAAYLLHRLMYPRIACRWRGRCRRWHQSRIREHLAGAEYDAVMSRVGPTYLSSQDP